VLLETDPALVPRRPIAAPRREFRGVGLPLVARWLLPVLHFDSRQLYFDFQTQAEEVAAVPACAVGIDTRELPAECHEVADVPRDLYEKLEQWDTPSIVIPHGTSWGLMTPPGFEIARELLRGQHDARRQRLFEVYSDSLGRRVGLPRAPRRLPALLLACGRDHPGSLRRPRVDGV
jgi:hypothetical protein